MSNLNEGEEGFSLLEMLVVLAIVSISTAIAFSSFRAHKPTIFLENIARDVAQMAQEIRMQAINQHTDMSLEVDVEAKTIEDAAGRRRFSVPPFVVLKVVTGKQLIRSGRKASIIFYADGTSTGGEVSFSGSNAEEVKVRIPWLSGIPTIFRKLHNGT